MKRIMTMQDISCIGKCSLTAALPVISAMGVETAVVPTAVLSTHTMFKNPAIVDLTSFITPMIAHWKKEGFTFDAIYTGYLASHEQLSLARQLFHEFKGTGFVLVDPCMADHGKLYSGFDMDFVKEMAQLCAEADYICPNLTEACLLLNEPYLEEECYDEAYIRSILKKLAALGARISVLTGVTFSKNTIGVYGYNAETDEYFHYEAEKQAQSFHGTGDLWASVFCGAMVRGKTMAEAMMLATDFTGECIRLTLQEENHNNYGTNFEQAIPYLLKHL